jgi:hypothetical protein
MDLSAEYAPPGWSMPESTEYWQFNLALSAFWPIYTSVSEQGFNLLSVSLCFFSSIDWIIGLGADQDYGIPFGISQTFGGLNRFSGLGGAVRGLPDGWGDGTLKWVGNIELRCNLPAFIHQELMFGVLAFLDSGAYADPPGHPEASALSSAFLMSGGLGAYLDFFGLGDIIARTVFVIYSPNNQGSSWVPLEIDFGMHF